MSQQPNAAYLTRAELRELSGRKSRATIIAWLKAERFVFVPDADGWPKVARAFHDYRLGLADKPPAVQHSGPDFSSLEGTA